METRKVVPFALACLGALSLAPLSATPAPTDVSVGVSVGSDGVEGFHLAVCEHYRVKRETVAYVRARHVSDDHLPVVFIIAERAHCSPEAVVALRVGGKSWFDIAVHFGLSVEIFHVEVHGDYGPPYGRALGHFKNRKRSEWGTIRLADDDVVALVSLKFLSARHGCSPDDVIKLHGKGESLVSLHGKLKAKGPGGAGGKAQNERKSAGPESAGKGEATSSEKRKPSVASQGSSGDKAVSDASQAGKGKGGGAAQAHSGGAKRGDGRGGGGKKR